MHKTVILLLSVCFLFGISQGLPVSSFDDDTSEENDVIKDSPSSNCIQTAWGCIDITDPAFRPRINSEANQNEETYIVKESAGTSIVEKKSRK